METIVSRSVSTQIIKDLEKKIVLLSGPRQVGKTYLSKGLFPNEFEYLNFDSSKDRRVLRDQSWNRDFDLIVFDEIHKMKGWKRWLKGIYDTEGVRPRLLATGSARLDTLRKGGDSLAGRHHLFRLHPFSVAELKGELNPEEAMSNLLMLGGFPEPFLSQSERFARRWRVSHLERILREDLLDLEKVRQIKQIEILVDLLSERVGSPISFASLARDLEVSPHTVKHWVQVLENLFVVFRVLPYSKKIARSILKEPKIYFFDIGRVKDEIGARLENLVACALYKRKHFLEDTEGEKVELCYLRDKSKREVDFVTVINGKLENLIEVKASDESLSTSLKHFASILPAKNKMQLVGKLGREKQYQDIKIRKASTWLSELES